MKHLSLVLMLLSSQSVFAAQEVVKEIITSGNWKAAEITQHTMWNKDACVAYTKGDDKHGVLGTFELYAEKIAGSADPAVYTEPTFQLVLEGAPAFVRGVLEDDAKTAKFNLVLSSTKDSPAVFGLISRIDDRKKILDLAKKAAGMKITLVDDKKRAVTSIKFSLKGSSKALSGAVTACGLDK